MFGCIGWIKWHMDPTDDLYEVHKIRRGIYLNMNFKWYADGSEWSEHKKQTNVIHCECKSCNVARALNYFKQSYPYNMDVVQAEKPLGYNYSFISMLVSSGSIIYPYILQVSRLKH